MHEGIDEPDVRFTQSAAYPTTVRIAGIVWIVFGGLILLSAAANLLLSFGMPAKSGAEGAGRAAGGICTVLLLVVFGAVFVHVGIQSIRGTAKDTLGNGMGSIVFGLLNLGYGVMLLGVGVAAGGMATVIGVLGLAVGFSAGVGLLAAGVLALVGRQDYKAWRRAHKRRTTTKQA
jgi:hypothetical protein